jgi:hypothetical protein
MPEGGDLTKISRRKAISRAAATGAIVAVGAVAGLGGYFAGTTSGGRVVTQRETITNTQTQTVTASQLPREVKIGVSRKADQLMGWYCRQYSQYRSRR